MRYVIQHIPDKKFYLNKMQQGGENYQFPVWRDGIKNAIVFDTRKEAEDMLRSLSHKTGKIIGREDI